MSSLVLGDKPLWLRLLAKALYMLFSIVTSVKGGDTEREYSVTFYKERNY